MRKQSQSQLNNLRTPTTEQAREIGRKGGIASAESKKKKKNLQNDFMALLEMGLVGKSKQQLLALGFDDSNADNYHFWLASLYKNSCKGNQKATDILFNLVDSDKKELELEKAKQEVLKLQLECEKLRNELNVGENAYEDLTPLAELLKGGGDK